MFGSSGYAAPVISMLDTFTPKYNQASTAIDCQDIAFAHQQQCASNSYRSGVVDISMDLLQYMSESLVVDPWTTTSTTCQQPLKHCQQQQQQGDAHTSNMQHCSSLMGSRCSTDCSGLMADTPTCSKAQQQQQEPPCRGTYNNSSNSSCDTQADAPAPASSIPSSAASDTVEDTLQSAASLPSSTTSSSSGSSSKAYDEAFVWQCYYGNPSSPQNQQQQRSKPLSPFAAFSTFPGFSL